MIALLKRIAAPQFGRRSNAAHPLACANAIIEELRADKQAVATGIRINRLLVIADCWSLDLLKRPLHSGETYYLAGTPTVTSVYSALRCYGSDEVTGFAKHPQLHGIDYPALEPGPEREILASVVQSYRNIAPYSLGNILRQRVTSPKNNGLISDAALAKFAERSNKRL